MKINTDNRKNLLVYNNALKILETNYNGDETLLSTIIKCSFHDGIMEALETSGMLKYMVFHGGTSLQRIYGSERLSEDLDFCVRENILKLSDFQEFCMNFKNVVEDNLRHNYDIDKLDIFFNPPKNDISLTEENGVLTWKIAINIMLGKKTTIN